MKKLIIVLIVILISFIYEVCGNRFDKKVDGCYLECIQDYYANLKEAGFSEKEISNTEEAMRDTFESISNSKMNCQKFCETSVKEHYIGYLK